MKVFILNFEVLGLMIPEELLRETRTDHVGKDAVSGRETA